MKKTGLSLIAAVAIGYSNFVFCGGVDNMPPDWTGFYLGGNAGYSWSQNNNVVTSGSTSFINPVFPSGSSSIAAALAQLGTNNFPFHPNGFIGGGQAGYNYQSSKKFLVGFDMDFDGLSNFNNTTTLQKTVNLVGFSEDYAGLLTVNQKINFLDTLRARLSYLCLPTFLVYATGGFAYGNVTLDTAWSAQESLGPAVFPTITAQNNLNKTIVGWTLGAGIEWLFKPSWSARFEYTYDNLRNINAPVTLAQINNSLSPPIPWGSAAVNTMLSEAIGSIRVGINYHFS